MKRKVIGAGMLLMYCVPWAYFALWGDATHGTMLLYALMIVMHAALCFVSLRTRRAWIAAVGSSLSGAVSLMCVKYSPLVEMSYYFKPFTAVHLTAAVSLMLFVAEAGAMGLWLKKKKQQDAE